MANKVQKKAAAPMPYNDSIRVDEDPVDKSTALVTSGGVHKAIEEALMHINKLDLSKWDQGQFIEYLANGKLIVFKVEFDSSNRPILITDNADNAMEIVWEESGGS